jgi:protein-L-isoaspartate(D-aspartate) O-methyltransferase
VDRAHYAPANPYQDCPQAIGWGATISAPHMHAHACEHLIDYLHPGSRVLDIGSGSGFLTHVLANLITDQKSSPPDQSDGHVIGIDHIQDLVDLANTNLQKSPDGRKFLESGKVKFIKGDGRLGWKEGGPYDAIHVGAAAKSLHPTLVEQLRAPGRMFIPVESEDNDRQQYIWVIDRAADGTVEKKRIFAVAYVPLTDAPKR